MSRPPLAPSLAPVEFRAYYWRKDEMLAFCREVGLSMSGGKAEVSLRVARFLETGERGVGSAAPRRAARMPERFTPETVVEAGWRCSQALRAFLRTELGAGFHFDGTARELVHGGAGRTLREVMDAWTATRAADGVRGEIAPQFEYNRFTRRFFEEHPGATRADAVRAWKDVRAQRRTP